MSGLPRSRVARSVDVGRLSRAVSRPGIDPRTWVSLAVVRGVTVDPAEGVFVAVTLLPDRREDTARLATPYAGPGFGAHLPLEVDDEVVVVAPSGDPAEGLVVAHRLHSASDPPPSEVSQSPGDLLLLAKSGANVVAASQGSGDVTVEARGDGAVTVATRGSGDVTVEASGAANAVVTALGAGKVQLGAGAGVLEPLIRGSTYNAAEGTLMTAMQAWLAALLVYVQIPVPLPAQTAAYTTAHGVFVAALSAFQSAAATFLTTKTEAT